MVFGEILRAERAKRKLTQQELADRTGFSRRSIEYWELGERDISFQNAIKVLGVLGISISISCDDECLEIGAVNKDGGVKNDN